MILRLSLAVAIMASALSCKKNDGNDELYGSVTLKIEHVWGPTLSDGTSEEFKLNEKYIQDETQEEISISNLQYYLSNIALKNTEGEWFEENYSYHLVTAEDGTNSTITIDSVTVSDYTDIKFTIGVDSARNVSGAQEGALSTANNMFWSWNTGYIFVKVEGVSSAVNDASDHFMYHLGGFTGDKNALTTKELDFHGSLLSVEKDAAASIHCMMNVAEVWNSEVKLAEMHKVHMPGAKAVKIANNIKDCFEVHHVHN